MKQPLIKLSLGILILASGVACTRVPVGSFGVSGSEGANAILLDTGNNTREEQKLRRLNQIDEKIQESADRLNAILDPQKSSEPANLEKLVVGDSIDPSLSYDRRFNAGQIIEQKMDQKARDLISGSTSSSTTSSNAPDSLSDPALLNDRQLRNQAEIDASLNTAASSDTEVPHEDSEPEENSISSESPSGTTASPTPSR